MKDIRIDIDNTICTTEGTDYENAQPRPHSIAIANAFYDAGHRITYWTARGVGSGKDYYELTEHQLRSWGCKYHKLDCSKPVYDLFIDDKSFNDFSAIPGKKLKYETKMVTLDRFYKQKKVCLLGNGGSIEKYDIDFEQYDVVIGINRIWRTKFAPYINIYYNSMSSTEKKNVLEMFLAVQKNENFQFFVCCPFSSGPKTRKELSAKIGLSELDRHMYIKVIARHLGSLINKRPLTGICALYHCLLSDPQKIDVYGFDFYANKYVENLKKYKQHDRLHDIDANLEFFSDCIVKHPSKIEWFK